jgi:hypothetical protein
MTETRDWGYLQRGIVTECDSGAGVTAGCV